MQPLMVEDPPSTRAGKLEGLAGSRARVQVAPRVGLRLRPELSAQVVGPAARVGAVIGTGLDEEHGTGGVLTEACGEDAPRRPTADDHDVIALLIHRTLPTSNGER